MSFRLTGIFLILFDALLRSQNILGIIFIYRHFSAVHTIKILIFQKINKNIMTLTPGSVDFILCERLMILLSIQKWGD